MKVTAAHLDAYQKAHDKLFPPYLFDKETLQIILQAVFDTFPTEPTQEMVERAWNTFSAQAGYWHSKNAMIMALRAALTEPPPRSYPWAEPNSKDPSYVTIYLGKLEKWTMHVPDFMEFDYETLTMKMKP